MSNELSSLRSSTTILVSEAKSLKAQLAALGATVSLPDLRDNVTRLEKQKEELTRRVAGLRAAQVKEEEEEGGVNNEAGDGRRAKVAPRDEKKKVEGDIVLCMAALSRRRRIVADMWDVLRDMMPPNVKSEEEWKVSPITKDLDDATGKEVG